MENNLVEQYITPVSREELAERISILGKGLSLLEEKVELCNGTLSLTGFIKDISHHFVNGLEGFSNAFISFISSPFSSNNPLPQYKDFNNYKNKAITISSSSKHASDYVSVYGKKDIAYISGCRCTLLELVNELKDVDSNCDEIVMKGLKEIDLYVSNGLSDPEFRISSRPYKIGDDLKKLRNFTDKIKRINSVAIDPTSLEDHQLIIKIMPTLPELKDITNGLNIIKDFTDDKVLPKVDDYVKSISMKAKTLAEELKDKNNNKCSNQFLKDIREVLTIGAEGVTYLATYYYLITQAVQAYKLLVTELK